MLYKFPFRITNLVVLSLQSVGFIAVTLLAQDTKRPEAEQKREGGKSQHGVGNTKPASVFFVGDKLHGWTETVQYVPQYWTTGAGCDGHGNCWTGHISEADELLVNLTRIVQLLRLRIQKLERTVKELHDRPWRDGAFISFACLDDEDHVVPCEETP